MEKNESLIFLYHTKYSAQNTTSRRPSHFDPSYRCLVIVIQVKNSLNVLLDDAAAFAPLSFINFERSTVRPPSDHLFFILQTLKHRPFDPFAVAFT